MTSHDFPDPDPTWYVQQPHAPTCVYSSDVIQDIQRTLSCPETGQMDEPTLNHIRGLQYAMGINATGVINRETAVAIQRLRDRYVNHHDS